MGKVVYVTRSQCNQSTVEALNNTVEVPGLASNRREADPIIALHTTVFASATDKSSAVCVIADDMDVYILLLYVSLVVFL